MRKNSRFIIILILLLPAALFTLKLYFSDKDIAKQANTIDIPLYIDSWEGEDISVNERTYEILETRDVIFRKYEKLNSLNNDSEKLADIPVYLCIVFSKSNRAVTHPPEVCYKGSGFSIEEKKAELIQFPDSQLIVANRLLIQKENHKQVVLYWYKAGNRYTPNYYKQQFNIITQQIMGMKIKSALIRFSIQFDDDNDRSVEYLKEFIRDIQPSIDEEL